MQIQNEKEGFAFTYSAKEQEELKKIREKYVPKEETKMEQLRKLDERVTNRANLVSIMIGTVGALVLGTGMSLVMTEIGQQLGLTGMMSMVLGIVIGLLGLLCVALAYPVYQWTLKKEREKAAPEILRLTEELMK